MTALTNMVDLSIEDNIAIITIDNPPVNALSHGVRKGLKDGVELCLANDDVRAIVLHCAGRTFIAGADITEFGAPLAEPGLHATLDTIENSTKPVIAAIHGTALGGGWETALVCHYRICDSAARFGLPEVHLGLLPGAGGTQRLPRVVGAEKALPMVALGTQMNASDALQEGLVEKVVDGDLRTGAIEFATQIIVEERPCTPVRDREEKLLSARANPEIFAEFRASIARKTRGFLAPEYNIRCIEAAVNLPFDEGIAEEKSLFSELMTSAQSRAQQYFFFAERQVAKIPGLPADTPVLPIDKVGVIGAGTMGGGIAMNMANVGIPVTMVETSQEALDRGLATIRRNYENTASKGRITAADVEERCALITGSLNMENLGDCDLIIEAVFENMEVKRDIFSQLDGIAKSSAILATNTSALDVNLIAAATSRPESVIGLHFFSPANVMKLLEIVRGDKTSLEVIKTCMGFAKRINKVAALVGVCVGFVGNRILARRQQQANQLILEGALPHEVDKVLFDFGLPMGAFQMSDLAGLDLGWDKETSRGETLRDVLCEADRRGQKTGAGFYDYDEKRNPTPSPLVEKIITDFSAKAGIERRSISEQEILERCIYPMINEGARILEEGIAIRASDVDVIWVYGYGWPTYRGGPMHYGDSIGLDKVVATLRKYHQSTGDAAFEPAPLMIKLLEEGKGFASL
jgi:3-hydroxyacyl-CoA dehydrogenase